MIIRRVAQRLRQKQLVQFALYVARRRSAATSVTHAEHDLLRRLAGKSRCVVEVGVHEGRTSMVLALAMDGPGVLYLVDPFPSDTRLERAFRMSFAYWIARREVGASRNHTPGIDIHFVRQTSSEAARQTALAAPADLVFIDARHDYESVREDFVLWQQKTSGDGVLAFHDSRRCDARPDLGDDTGPVRLLNEIRRGLYGSWAIAGEADSVVAIRRTICHQVPAQ
jgi:predicted O-methyltransferase YrrM